LNNSKSHANRKFAGLLFFVFERAGDQSKEAKEKSQRKTLILKLLKKKQEVCLPTS
jgi:hypothetical protein